MLWGFSLKLSIGKYLFIAIGNFDLIFEIVYLQLLTANRLTRSLQGAEIKNFFSLNRFRPFCSLASHLVINIESTSNSQPILVFKVLFELSFIYFSFSLTSGYTSQLPTDALTHYIYMSSLDYTLSQVGFIASLL